MSVELSQAARGPQKVFTPAEIAALPIDHRIDGIPNQRRHRNANRPVWEESPSTWGMIGKFLILTVVVGLVAIPMWGIVVTSLSDAKTVQEAGGLVLFPKGITFASYAQLLSGGVVAQAAWVSVIVTVTGTVIATVVSALAAYGLSKPGTALHRPILFLFIITMFFSAGLIPTYLWISSLGLRNSLWALILPTCISAFNLLIMRNFFMGIDTGIIEAARIDGASEWKILFSIVMPMSKAVTAVIALFYGVGFWNAFFNAVLYIDDSSKWPLQMVLRQYVLQGQSIPGVDFTVAQGQLNSVSIKMAIMVLAVLPILIVYPFVQKHFTKGVIFGAIKG
ncbi:carbohydrate ABC transporter permease [Jonesia denitrificans]|uniref:Binding-protein-dependent transport systems inner membrane component n=1 Tax=Jonesia denitrificans (strain ATCC 14870 / DSM 20603 / BCRC 15368 / CIP 55.134 / JCM 11481 / NBRC 15587 / NCTC 10816 / Prevot 55134) TaxID=471856 RepID=C7QZB2_JONDD|nr:carbohydrate ABC transporter permease [Jonesia denitrificans]ACV09410.1 binding-protein-dependent transport systems inner membrane component [Jonesia denitrificans DSM 20603]SQH21730.1 Maltose transport system permease protein malG [Jonesia denitrificans]